MIPASCAGGSRRVIEPPLESLDGERRHRAGYPGVPLGADRMPPLYSPHRATAPCLEGSSRMIASDPPKRLRPKCEIDRAQFGDFWTPADCPARVRPRPVLLKVRKPGLRPRFHRGADIISATGIFEISSS